MCVFFFDTGCKVQLVDNGTVKDEATIVIKGEIDGNGVIDSDDAIYLLRNTLFAGLYPVVTEDDVDGNGKITAADARLALRISAKLEKATELQTTVADMDKNGKITAADARKILRISAKLE